MVFTMTIEEINTVLKGLGELPLKESGTLASKLQAEGNKQFEEEQLKKGAAEPFGEKK